MTLYYNFPHNSTALWNISLLNLIRFLINANQINKDDKKDGSGGHDSDDHDSNGPND